MASYTLYYWPIPFRGQFVRTALAHVGAVWDEPGMDAVMRLKDASPSAQDIPHMGPPVLVDHAAEFSISQTPAILAYLGEKHGLIPSDAKLKALTAKICADCEDILYEMTRHNGAQMWTEERWAAYRPRLSKWMAIYEETGRRHGLTEKSGWMLGTATLSLADLSTYTLWAVMTTQLPALRPQLLEAAPAIIGLCDRVGALPEQAALWTRSAETYGDTWCEGEIEASLRSVVH